MIFVDADNVDRNSNATANLSDKICPRSPKPAIDCEVSRIYNKTTTQIQQYDPYAYSSDYQGHSAGVDIVAVVHWQEANAKSRLRRQKPWLSPRALEAF
jgi:hypothetical protein